MSWCLTREESDKFKKALRDGTINPNDLIDMSSLERREFLAKFVGEENALEVNGLFESKLLLKNQQRGMITWAKQVSGISAKAKRDIISRIENMTDVLDPKDQEQLLHDLAAKRLRVEVTQEEAKQIADMSREVTKTREKWNKLLDEHPEWQIDPVGTRKEWMDLKTRLNYGASKVALEEYVNGLKLSAKKITFKEDPLRKTTEILTDTIPSVTKSLLASLDNSFFGRQGIKALLDPATSKIWVRNFMKSWGDITKELKGEDAMALIRAEIYSRPNAMNGKYKAGNYRLEVGSEEAFPSSLPEKIPAFGRLFKASESAYNGAALRLRADLADRIIKLAEDHGLNMNDKEQAQGAGHLIGSLTGRGSLTMTPENMRRINVLFFSARFLKANVDTLTAHMFDKKATPFVKKEAAKSLLRMTMTAAFVMSMAKMIDPDSVDEDPRSTNFGKIKIFGHWVDITGGMASLMVLAARIIPTKHDGKWGWWFKSSAGNWTELSTGKYGSLSAWDILMGFGEGKLSPVAGLFRDILKGEDYQGNPLTVSGTAKNLAIPLPVQNAMSFYNDPNSSFILGSIILDGLGFSTSTSVIPNKVSNAIPEKVEVKNDDLISYVATYAKALDTDPVTAFNRIFTGQKIRYVTNSTIIVERIPVDESQAIKEERGGKKPELKLDHTLPLQLGGGNEESNLKLVPTSTHRSYTTVENKLGIALRDGKITKKKAQTLILDYKSGKINEDQVMKAIE